MYFVLSTFKEKNIVDQNKVTVDNDDDPFIPSYFFKVNKRFVFSKLPFCENNEIRSKHFLKKFIILRKKIDITISWKTRKIETVFCLKDKKLYPAYKITMGFVNVEKTTLAKQKDTP